VGVSSEAIKMGPNTIRNGAIQPKKYICVYTYDGHKNCHCKRGDPLEIIK